MRHINEIIIHTTATRPEWYAGRGVQAKIDEIRRWHTTAPRNWSDIGYHYVIDRDGAIGTGRPLERMGAHVKGRNRASIGIALVGGFGGATTDSFEDHYTPAQDAALRALIRRLQRDYPTATMLTGHHEYANKACPCFDVRDWFNRPGIITSPRAPIASPRPAQRPAGGLADLITRLFSFMRGKP